MSERRDRMSIIVDLLTSIQQSNGSIKPTRLMYKSNLAHSRMIDLLKELSDKNLIAEASTKSGKLIRLTEDGYKFLGEYRQVKQFMDSYGF